MLACHGMSLLSRPGAMTGPTYTLQQPTAFSLHTYILQEVFNNPELIGSLSAYAYARNAEIDDLEHQKLVARRAAQSPALSKSGESRASILFLRIFAAADYYTLDKSLMENVPPVLVDIILDPYLLNVFPQSLLPTAGYILLVTVASWYVSGYVWQIMLKLVGSSNDVELKRDDPSKIKTS
jgi:hypothetical protein